MKQALHILKKDIRYLQREIGLVAVLSLIFAWTQVHSAHPGDDPNALAIDLVLLVAAGYLVARLIHAEAIPGDNQFWITRPYNWKSLLGAKLLFILAFVNVPIFIAQLLILIFDRFPIGAAIPGLLWSQVLIVLCASLPFAALAAMTSGIVPLVFTVLIFLTVGTLAIMDAETRFRMIRSWAIAVDWIRSSIVVVALPAIALPVVYVQYKNRRTFFCRIFAVGTLALTTLAYLYTPISWEVSAESLLFKQPPLSTSVQISAGPAESKKLTLGYVGYVMLHLPVEASGIPNGGELNMDALRLAFQLADGRAWKDTQIAGTINTRNGSAHFESGVVLPESLFNREPDQPITLHGTAYFTLFGNERAATIPIERTPVNVMDGLQCYTGDYDNFYCRSMFRWPFQLIYKKIGNSVFPVRKWTTYSPFPADLNLNPLNEESTGTNPAEASEVTIIMKEPLGHFQRDFEVHNLRLSDFTAAAELDPNHPKP